MDGIGAAGEVDPARFYDDLAEDYHRIYPAWEASSQRQGDVLNAVIAAETGPGPRRVLDCAVGIGTQLLGLARHGHRLHGSDVSPDAVARARREGARRGLDPRLIVADMRALPFRDESFDVVVCADNALPHLLTAADVVQALTEMARVVVGGGLLLVTTRDYDALLAERPRVSPPQLFEGPDHVTVTIQLWEWQDVRYVLRHLQLHEHAGGWQVVERRTLYRAWTRAELTRQAMAAGLELPAWRRPTDTGYFQPMLTARKPLTRSSG